MGLSEKIEKRVSNALILALEKAEGRIKQNMIDAGTVVTGKTIGSLRYGLEGNTKGFIKGFISGAEHIPTLEDGISPEQSRLSFTQLREVLIEWADAKFGGFVDEGNAFRWGSAAAFNQKDIGSVLFRQGGGRKIYSHEKSTIADEMKRELGNIFTTERVLDEKPTVFKL